MSKISEALAEFSEKCPRDPNGLMIASRFDYFRAGFEAGQRVAFDAWTGIQAENTFLNAQVERLTLEIDRLNGVIAASDRVVKNGVRAYAELLERAEAQAKRLKATKNAAKVIEAEEAVEQLRESGFCDSKGIRIANLELLLSRIAFLLGVDPTQTAIEAEITKLKAIRYDHEESVDKSTLEQELQSIYRETK